MLLPGLWRPGGNNSEAAVTLVSNSLLKVAQDGETQALELKESEREIAASRQATDMTAARARLSRCLDDIRVRALRRNETALLPSAIASPMPRSTLSPDCRIRARQWMRLSLRGAAGNITAPPYLTRAPSRHLHQHAIRI